MGWWFKGITCNHDWQEVDDGLITEEEIGMPEDMRLAHNYHCENFLAQHGNYSPHFSRYWENKVCLKCNKCIDGKTILKNKIGGYINDLNELKEKERKRSKLAKKMWKNCKGVS